MSSPRTWLAPAAMLGVLLSCSGDAGPEEQPSSSAGQGRARSVRTDRPSSGLASAGDEAQVRVLEPQGAARRGDFDAIAAAVNPGWAEDPWPGELLASSAERLLLQVAEHLATGGDVRELRTVVTRDLKGSIPREGDSPEGLEGVELLGWIQDQLSVGAAAPVVQASVIEVDAPEPDSDSSGSARTRVRLRTGTDPQTGSPEVRVQRDLVAVVEWRLGKRVRISSIEVESVETVELATPFRDVTATVLGEGKVAAGADPSQLMLGALEAAGRTDALASVGDILTAMHGVAAGDLDGDGWDDLVVARAGGQANLVWMNQGGSFVEEGAQRGLDWLEGCGGVLIADLDGDGARDVVLGVGPDVVVAWNDGSGVFDARSVLPRAGEARVYSISAADVDLDGDLDLYDTRYFRAGGYGAQAPTPYHDAVNGAPNVFWRNLTAQDQPRRFSADTEAVGLGVQNNRFSMVSIFDDMDGDGDLDLYVANDFGRNNLYLANVASDVEGGVTFVPAPEGPLTDKAAGMGLSVADADLDGRSDLVVSNMFSSAGGRVTRDPRFLPDRSLELRAEFVRHARGNTIFRGLGDGAFEDVTGMTGAAPGGWAWGSRFVDWNRDGLPDLVVPNGFLSGRKGPDLQSFFWRRVVGATPLPGDEDPARLDAYLGAWSVISQLSQFGRQDWNARERTFAYLNRGELRFDDVSLASGLGVPDDGRSLAVADLDHDGRQDLVFRNRTAPILRVFQGVAPGGQATSFRLRQEGLNRDAIGALVTLTVGGVPRNSRILAGDGFLGSSPPEAFYGLGPTDSVEGLSVCWPDGVVEDFSPLQGGRLIGSAWWLVRGAGAVEQRYLQGDPRPGLSAGLPAPLRGGQPGPPRNRVPLHAEFPLGGWRLPTFAGAAVRADERCSDQGLLVLLWASAVPGSQEALTRMAELDLPVHVIALDGVRETDAAREASVALGLGEVSGRADRATRLIIDLVLGRALAPYEEMPLPLGLLLDGDGDLACLYVGAVSPDVIQEDAARLAAREDPRGTTCLTGGQWVLGPQTRRLEGLYAGLRNRGFNEFVDHLEAKATR